MTHARYLNGVKRFLPLALGLIAAVPAYSQVKPRLVVLISIDQFRGDYIRRFTSDFLPAKTGSKVGGFRWLMETGADFVDAHHNHLPTETGPGHAVLFTGSTPAIDGIVANTWRNRATGKSIYCVDDPSVETVGGGQTKPMSPRNLLVSTVGDELKLATNNKAKVVGISLKDRAAILMAGHAADTVIWFDSKQGSMVSSSFYFPSKALPAWVTQRNAEDVPKKAIGKAWTPLLSLDRYELTRQAPFVKNATGNGFDHAIKSIGDFTLSPYAQQYVLDTAKKAVVAEGLGQDDVPDVMVVNLATNDYIGHAYGPNSPEVMDITVQTDRMLSDLFNELNAKVKGGLERTLIILSGDHGVVPIPEETIAERMSTRRLPFKSAEDALEVALDRAFGEGDWVIEVDAPNVYLNQATMALKGADREKVEKVAQEVLNAQDGVYFALTRSQLLLGQLPLTNWGQMMINGFNPKLCGDLMIVTPPGNYFYPGTGTGHGSAWDYDSHVPILLHGPGIQTGKYFRRVHTQDIASTVCSLLGIENPSGNTGKLLFESLK